MREIDIFKDYENARLIGVEEHCDKHRESTYFIDELGGKDINGIPISLTRDKETGKLVTTFIPDSHLLAIGATRSGKTTGYVIPTMNILLSKKNKPSMVISDPKNELYSASADKFRKEGYKVIYVDFSNSAYSDCWNPLSKIYDIYKEYIRIGNSVPQSVKKGRSKVYEAEGEEYSDYNECINALEDKMEGLLGNMDKEIESFAEKLYPLSGDDPYWDLAARDVFKAIIYGMLEDSQSGEICDNTFNMDTVLTILDMFGNGESKLCDNGYFLKRPKTSKAFQLADKCIINQAPNTRKCILSICVTKLNKFRCEAVRKVMSINTFDMSELDDCPTVIFLSFRDEDGGQYDIISMLLTSLYIELIGISRKKGTKLDRPFYFLLDEFGNLPKFNDFDKVISACGGRNIWFLLVLQSYAQLENVYGSATANVIKDNLNVHVFFGTNNPETKQAFSTECGKKTIISPISAYNGEGELIERFDKDTVALVPVSMLDRIKECECIVTRMREDVLMTRIERSYLCPEFPSDNARPENREFTANKIRKKFVFKNDDDKKEEDKDDVWSGF